MLKAYHLVINRLIFSHLQGTKVAISTSKVYIFIQGYFSVSHIHLHTDHGIFFQFGQCKQINSVQIPPPVSTPWMLCGWHNCTSKRLEIICWGSENNTMTCSMICPLHVIVELSVEIVGSRRMYLDCHRIGVEFYTSSWALSFPLHS